MKHETESLVKISELYRPPAPLYPSAVIIGIRSIAKWDPIY